MYETRFGLSRRPFPATPDCDHYYPATAHEAARAALERALADDEGLALLIGQPGTGKTLLGYTLVECFKGECATAFLTNSHVPDRTALLQAILYDLALPYEGSEQTLRLRLTDFLLENCAAGKRTLLIVDEAHLLSADLLEELRLLANLEAGSRKAIQIVLIAQPEIVETLKQPKLASLLQRLVVRCQLPPLSAEEAYDYLLHHLRQAGVQPEQVIDESALEVIARGTAGIPRLLNQAAHQALLLADAGDLSSVDAEAALEALSLLGLGQEESAHSEEPVAGSIEAFEIGEARSPDTRRSA